jgi:hypothetical protein
LYSADTLCSLPIPLFDPAPLLKMAWTFAMIRLETILFPQQWLRQHHLLQLRLFLHLLR